MTSLYYTHLYFDIDSLPAQPPKRDAIARSRKEALDFGCQALCESDDVVGFVLVKAD